MSNVIFRGSIQVEPSSVSTSVVGSVRVRATDNKLIYNDGNGELELATGTIVTAAEDVTYSNATSGLAATDVQAAIDEIDASLDTAEADIIELQQSVSSISTGGQSGPVVLVYDDFEGVSQNYYPFNTSKVDGTDDTDYNISSIDPLRGANSLELVLTGSGTAAGAGWRKEITIPEGYENVSCYLSFVYKIPSGVFTSGDVGVYLGTPESATTSLGTITSAQGRFVGSFSVASAQNIVFVLEQEPTAGWTMQIDDICIEPYAVSAGGGGLTSPVAIADGGTGQTSKTAAFDALAPTTTKGDLIVYNGTDNIRVAVGANNLVLTADSAETSGVKWASASAASVPNAEIIAYNGNGFGSTDTQIRRFTSTSVVGTDIVYADSSTLGATFSIAVTGIYAIHYHDGKSGAANVGIGITVNDSALTTRAYQTTFAQGLRALAYSDSSSGVNQCSTTLKLNAGNIVRAKGEVGGTWYTDSRSMFTITRIA